MFKWFRTIFSLGAPDNSQFHFHIGEGRSFESHSAKAEHIIKRSTKFELNESTIGLSNRDFLSYIIVVHRWNFENWSDGKLPVIFRFLIYLIVILSVANSLSVPDYHWVRLSFCNPTRSFEEMFVWKSQTVSLEFGILRCRRLNFRNFSGYEVSGHFVPWSDRKIVSSFHKKVSSFHICYFLNV